ncbi:conserved protein of unknown function [Paenibacillus alvei]|jgi:hypothetical protein|uniref:Uncharacterized protein n=4 Tax=Paenibacillus TaxID=44249 RepID=A0A383RGB5_PAEAL|nr:conserved protein of unknown function [Paenibacillus alvei]
MLASIQPQTFYALLAHFKRRLSSMSIPKHRRENADKIRKQTPHAHGKVKSFKELVEE